MNSKFLNYGIRLAAMTAFTLLPVIADTQAGHRPPSPSPAPGPKPCTYSATSQVVSAKGGNVNVQVYTQPGCPWTAQDTSFASVYAGRQGSGSGSVLLHVPPNPGKARAAVLRGYNTVQSNQIPGRSGPTVQVVFQSILTQYGR
jgi:hypothetical protein